MTEFTPPVTREEAIAWRKARGLTQQDMAYLLGIPVGTWNHVENGKNGPYRMVYGLAIAYIENHGLYRGAHRPTTDSGLTETNP